MSIGDKHGPAEKVIAAVNKIEYDKKKDGQPTGEKGKIYTVVFVGGSEVKTFSDTCAAAFEAQIGNTVMVTVEEDKPYNNKPQFKPVNLTVDGKTAWDVSSEPKRGGYGGGGGGKSNYIPRPDWTYESIEERYTKNRSIERQVAFKGAVEIVTARIQFDTDFDPNNAIKYVEDAMVAFAEVLAPEKPGSGGPTKSKAAAKPKAGESGPLPGDGNPIPGPDSSGGF